MDKMNNSQQTNGVTDAEDVMGACDDNSLQLHATSASAERSKKERKASDSTKTLSKLIYKIDQNPPLYMAFLFAFQQSLLSISTALTVAMLVSELICARDDDEIRTRIISATFLMIGVSTFCMSTFGVRLPIFQGPAVSYIVPLFALTAMPEWQCPSQEELASHYSNTTSNLTVYAPSGLYAVPQDLILRKISQLSGSLMLAAILQIVIGLTGMVGLVLRFIGPVTIVPAIVLIGLFVYKVAVTFSEAQWGVAALTCICAVVLALYLRHRSTPVPAWSRRRGFHWQWRPLHQMFAILISVMVGWAVSFLLTYLDVLSADPGSSQFYARTDTRLSIVQQAHWFSVPYPGQFGMPSFHVGAFVSFLIATVMAVLDSLGDYSACARACHVPQPPAYACNRGIAVEGLMSLISGATGACHATVSYGGNIGAIGLTKVASRRVFQAIGLVYLLFAVVNKIGAVFLTIPYPVLGGCQIIVSGIFTGVVLSNLQNVDMQSTRNMAIIGISLLLGLMLPHYTEKYKGVVGTGNAEADRFIGIMISNPVFVGGVVACFLDNTVPGTLRERGLGGLRKGAAARHAADNGEVTLQPPGASEHQGDDKDGDEFENGYEVYEVPWIPQRLQRSRLARYIPIFPGQSPVTSLADVPLMAL